MAVDTFIMSPKDDDKSTVWEGRASEAVCLATRSRPAVTIKWYLSDDEGHDTEITEGVSQSATTNPSDSETFDVESKLLFTATRETNGYTLKCMTTGQIAATSRQVTATLNVLCKFITKLHYMHN